MLVMFGDNQFIGVNHTGTKVKQYTEQFENAEDIAVVLRGAWDAGIRDFSFTVRPLTTEAINLVLDDCPFSLHPAVPYAHTINEVLTESGFVGLFKKYLDFKSCLKLPVALIQSFFDKYTVAWELYLKSELSELPSENIKSIGLLNVCADFFLGAERFDVLDGFCISVRKKFNTIPVIYTMNFPKMAEKIWKNDESSTRIIFNYNELGFRMNPSKTEVIEAMDKYSNNDIGVMSVFSGIGGLDPIDYIESNKSIKSVTFGSASASRIKKNYESLNSNTKVLENA